jgi:acetyl esterase/lipase
MDFYRLFVTLPMMVVLHFFPLEPTLNSLAPSAGTMETRDIAYAPVQTRRKLDVYAQRSPTKLAPVVVFFYGGGWTSGERAAYRFVGTALDAAGMVVVIPDYRLFPEARFPAFMEDAARAVAWTMANAARFGGDPHRIFIMGHSAGAHIATLLALDPIYLQAVGMSPSDLCGVIGLAGPYEPKLVEGDINMKAVFGEVADLQRVQPMYFADHVAPPMLLLTGSWDNAVDPQTTFRLASKLRATGSDVVATLYGDITHHALLDSITTQLSFLSPARQDVLSFIASHGACGGGSLLAASAKGSP